MSILLVPTLRENTNKEEEKTEMRVGRGRAV